MSRFLWLNPVVRQLYDHHSLSETLHAKGFTLVDCEQDHLNLVAEKYRYALRQAKNCLADMRCPKAVSYVRQRWDVSLMDFPDIQPILIHCAMELAERYAHGSDTLYITTPCHSLSDLGQRLALPNTLFQTWNEFRSEHQFNPPRKALLKSPIPPGFFSPYGDQAAILSSKEAIDRFFTHRTYLQKAIAEMLFCTDGCHHGDGV